MEELIKYYEFLTESEKIAFNYIYKHQDEILNMKINELVKASFSSKTVIINLCHKLGFSGFVDFKYYLKNCKEKSIPKNIDLDDSMLSDIFVKTSKLLDKEEIKKCIKLIKKSRNIYIIARGTSKAIGYHLEYLLLTLGVKCIFLKDYNLINTFTRMMSNDEALVLISLSGETQKVIDAAKIAKVNNVKTISLTAFSNNSVAKLSTYNLYCASNDFMTQKDDSISRLGLFYLVEKLILELKKDL